MRRSTIAWALVIAIVSPLVQAGGVSTATHGLEEVVATEKVMSALAHGLAHLQLLDENFRTAST